MLPGAGPRRWLLRALLLPLEAPEASDGEEGADIFPQLEWSCEVRYSHATATLLPMLLPCCRHAAAMLLPRYCHAIAMYSHATTTLLPMPMPCCCHAAAMYSHATATLLPMLLPCCCQRCCQCYSLLSAAQVVGASLGGMGVGALPLLEATRARGSLALLHTAGGVYEADLGSDPQLRPCKEALVVQVGGWMSGVFDWPLLPCLPACHASALPIAGLSPDCSVHAVPGAMLCYSLPVLQPLCFACRVRSYAVLQPPCATALTLCCRVRSYAVLQPPCATALVLCLPCQELWSDTDILLLLLSLLSPYFGIVPPLHN